MTKKANWLVPYEAEQSLGKMYRYEEISTLPSEYDDCTRKWIVAEVRLILSEYQIIRKTPGGVWIRLPWGVGRRIVDRKFILMTAYKKWACPTKEEALESFIARKHRHRDILESRLAVVQRALELAEKMKETVDGKREGADVLHRSSPQDGQLPTHTT